MKKPMSSISNPGLHRQIAEKAYELFQKRGQVHGHDLDDWVEAERHVMATLGARTVSTEPARRRPTSPTHSAPHVER
jgi:hypothetical protein